MKSSLALLSFYEAYADWLETQDDSMSSSFGLCQNLCNYFEEFGEDFTDSVIDEMQAQFVNAGLNVAIPFNNYGMRYSTESSTNTCHLNPNRVAWVMDRIKDAKEG